MAKLGYASGVFSRLHLPGSLWRVTGKMVKLIKAAIVVREGKARVV
jgi:hypothetical protein